MASASDVPQIYDLVINTTGYIFANVVDPNVPFRTQRAKYGYTPTFIQRTNVSGDFGDNQQDFWLTASMRDWSLGEDQKFYKVSDPDKARQFWLGSNVNVSMPGQVSIQRAANTLTFAAACSGSGANPAGGTTFTASSTNLYEISSNGTITDRGAHGAGGQPTCFATDGVNLYLSGSACTNVTKFSLSGHTFASFSATPMDDIVFLNNTLYGVATGQIFTISTSGAAAAQFTWKDATGNALSGAMKLEAFGGKVMIMRNSGSTNGAELWQYDGSGVTKLAEYPPNFQAKNMCVSEGIVFLIGVEGKVGDGNRTAIWYYANGTIGRAWANYNYTTSSNTGCDVTPFGSGLIFTDFVNGVIRFYDLSFGGVSSVASYTADTSVWLATSNQFVLLTHASTNGTLLYNSTVATTATVQTSIVDFDSSLTKLFRGVIVDWVNVSGDSGGSVDIAYQVDSVDGAYTSLQTGAASGTEYDFSGTVTGRGMSLKVTLNKGASTYGPIVKRIYLRAAPTLNKFRNAEYILDMTSRDGHSPVMLRNDEPHPMSGQEMLTAFLADATSGSPLSITDRVGSFTGIVELENLDIVESRPNQYLCRFTVRAI